MIILQSCSPSLTQYQTASTLGENKSSHILATEIAQTLNIYFLLSSERCFEITDIGLGFGVSHHAHVGVGLNLKQALIKDKVFINFPVVVKGIGETPFMILHQQYFILTTHIIRKLKTLLVYNLYLITVMY